jgi:hypothetical protein
VTNNVVRSAYCNNPPGGHNLCAKKFTDEGDFKYITNVDDAHNFALSLYNEGSLGGGTTDKVHCGLDAEWNAFNGTSHITRCIQIAIPGAPTVVCHLHPAININNSSNFSADLKRLLEDKRMVPVGRGVGGDISRLCKLGVTINNGKNSVV